MPALLLEDGGVLLLEEDADPATAPVTKALTWSLPEDRVGGVAADGAMRGAVTVDEENDARLTFDAVGTAAMAEDITAWTIEAEIALDLTADPIATAPTVTITGGTSFEVAFAADDASDLPPEVYVLSVKRTDTDARTELARAVLTVRATAFNPP